MDNYGYIYKTTNLINGKIYIGQRHGVFTKKYLGSGIYLRKSLREHGKNNFKVEIICYLSSQEQLN